MSLINTFIDGEIRTQKNEHLLETQKGLQIANEGVSLANRTISQQQAQLRQKDEELAKMKVKLYNAEDDLEEYKQLLCKPMLEIAQKNGNFKETYEAQMQIMADWMVSQKAFKELAIQFGFEKKLSKDDVVQMAKDKKIDVINGNNDPLHNTNSDEFIDKHRSKV